MRRAKTSRVKFVLREIGASQEGEIKFSTRIGEKSEGQYSILQKPLLTGATRFPDQLMEELGS